MQLQSKWPSFYRDVHKVLCECDESWDERILKGLAPTEMRSPPKNGSAAPFRVDRLRGLAKYLERHARARGLIRSVPNDHERNHIIDSLSELLYIDPIPAACHDCFDDAAAMWVGRLEEIDRTARGRMVTGALGALGSVIFTPVPGLGAVAWGASVFGASVLVGGATTSYYNGQEMSYIRRIREYGKKLAVDIA